MEYGPLPLMVHSGMFGNAPANNQALVLYQQMMQTGRKAMGGPSATLRSPVLEDFRANKTRRWELRVGSMNNHLLQR